jgi:glycerophosphoryl diester phosphodiesterase
MNFWKQSPNYIYVAAHRGDSARYPENTMESFRAAVEEGVDQIELDVRMTKDGEAIIIHDDTVDRTSNGSGKVIDLSLAELRELDFGSKKDPQFAGAKAPTFREFMDYIKDHPTMTVDVELKEYPTEGREKLAFDFCDRILQTIDEYGFTDRVVINSFSGKLNEYVHAKYGNKYRQHVFFPQKHLGECTVDPYSYAYCACMFGATKEDFDTMIARGVQPWVGASVRNAETVEAVIEQGAYLITCNNPDEILALLRERGYHD